MKLIKGLLLAFLLLAIILTIVTATRGKERNGSDPIITSDLDPLTISCEYTREDLLEGLTAYDVEDGYITDRIIPGEFALFTEKGVSEIDYYVYDSDDNCGRFKREVVFSDYSSPEVSLLHPLVFYAKEASDGLLMSYIYGEDCFDGDVKHIKVNSSDIDYSTVGNYTISISLINSFGDTANYDLPVHIIKKTYGGLEIRLKENLIYIISGTEFNPADYVKEVELRQTEELVPRKDWAINIQSNVNTSKAGVYEVRYMIKKEKDEIYGNVSGITWLTVIVRETSNE